MLYKLKVYNKTQYYTFIYYNNLTNNSLWCYKFYKYWLKNFKTHTSRCDNNHKVYSLISFQMVKSKQKT